MQRLRIQDRILMLVVGAILPFAITTFVVVERRVTAEAHKKLGDELDAARSTFRETLAEREEGLSRTARLVSELPYFKAAVAVYDPAADLQERNDQINTIVPVALDIMRSVGLDYVAVLDPAENVLVTLRGGKVTSEAVLDAPTRALGTSVMGGGDGAGNLIIADDLYQVAMAPMLVDGNILGTLLLGRRLDQPLATRLQGMTHTDVLIQGPNGLEALASTDAGLARARAVREWFQRGAAVTPALLRQPGPVKLAGTRYLSLSEPILDPLGAEIGAFVLQRNLDEALKYVGSLRQLMLAIWAASLLAALLFASLLARQISRPIQRLVELTRSISAGDFTREVPVDGMDELSGLANAFNRMTRGLRRTLQELAATNRRLADRGAELEERHRELREAQAQLVQADKLAAIGELGAGLAHELNQPLTSVKGFAQLLMARLEADSPHRKSIGHIEQAASHMARIVRNLRDFSRESKGERSQVNLNRVFEDSLVLVENQLKKSQIKLEMDLQPDLPLVEGDASQLQQVLTNLLTNARDALEGQVVGRVRLVTRVRGRFVMARVEDTGPGIPPEVRAQMFRAFYTTKEAGKGTGLGLSISRGIAENHGGRLGVHSRPGVGTTFWVVLPALEAGGMRKAA